jgi:5-methylcytosine-specific restriction enzyme A
MSLRQVLERICTDYGTAKVQSFEKHPLARYIRSTAANEVEGVLAGSDPDLIVKGSAGTGNCAEVPWIAIFDPLVTDSATAGYYVVCLFHTSEPLIHLSLNQGTTATREEFGAKTRQVLADRAAFVRKRLADFADLIGMHSIDLGSDARLPGDYAAAHALGVKYRSHQLPSDEELRADLYASIRAYRALTFRGGLELTAGDGATEEDLTAPTLVEKRQYRFASGAAFARRARPNCLLGSREKTRGVL